MLSSYLWVIILILKKGTFTIKSTILLKKELFEMIPINVDYSKVVTDLVKTMTFCLITPP